jgi:uncharacterized membrane protein YpjA
MGTEGRGETGGHLLPDRWVRYYLENAPSLVWLLLANAVAVLVGIRYYVETMPGVSTFLWPFYADSPTAVMLALLSFTTLLPLLGRRLADNPNNRPLAYLYTLSFVWLVKMGLWTAVALHLRLDLYFPAVWAYFGILLTHLGFLLEAYALPHFGRTTRGALVFALAVALLNDALDYGFGLVPPLRYEAGPLLAVSAVGLSVLSVALASRAFERL